ncbi:MAG: EAL domain-containing protein [Parasphingorhabdus sp.]
MANKLNLKRSLFVGEAFGDEQNLSDILSRFLPTGVFFTDVRGQCTYVNETWLGMSGLTVGQALGFGWSAAIHPEDQDRVMREWNSAIERKQSFDLEFRFQKPSKSVNWIHAQSCPYFDKRGQVVGYIGSCFDISKRKELEQQLDQTNRQFCQAEAIANIGSWRLDINRLKLEWSDQIFNIHGIEPANTPTLREALNSYPGDAGRQLFDAISDAVDTSSAFDIETDFMNSKEEMRRVRNMGQAEFLDGKPVAVFGICQDVTDRYQLEQQLRSAANTDELTNIPNRALYNKVLENLTCATNEQPEKFTLFLIDLDEFKCINDTMGHPIGDELLVAVANRLSNIPSTSLIARLGGDEFAVICKEASKDSMTNSHSLELINCFSSSFEIGSTNVKIGASIGAAKWPMHGRSVETLTKNADFALYQAKEKKNGKICYFDENLGAIIEQKRKLNKDLRSALVNNEFTLHFQPLFCLKEKRVDRFEALLRWNNPLSGLIPPNEFIPALEESGLITQVGEWVLREACSVAANWPDDIGLSVNVSPIQLQESNLQHIIVQSLARHNIAANRLELEVTENVLMDNVETAQKKLAGLRSLGVRLSLDDFGSGFSSLSYLHSFSFDSVKIDRSFVADLCENKDSQAIIHSISRLARALNFETVAEGVESPEQLEFLSQQGCNKVQGYLFSKPVSANEVPRLLQNLSANNYLGKVA